VQTVTTSVRARRVTGRELGKMAQEMVPTLIGIGLIFFGSFAVVWYLLTSLPIPPSLRGSLPKSTSDIRLLSSSITHYMAASPSGYGYLHTLVALGLTAVWTHAWSVPGSVVLNILIGALLPSLPAVLFLSFTTMLGGLCSYLLSRPLSPLISLLFPTQLAVVRASIAAPPSTSSSHSLSTKAGGQQVGSGAWRKLLVMRATGLVPWSGMNVACGVVGVRWEVFCATFFVGSLSWNVSLSFLLRS
jgi:hypothetical protein